MTPEDATVIREAIADTVPVIADLTDVLTAISAAATLAGETLARVEGDVLAIAGLMEGG
jgi:hypothetical protein